MKFKELKKKSAPDRAKELEKASQELMRIRAQISTGSVGKEAGRVRELKRTIARIKTLEVNTSQ